MWVRHWHEEDEHGDRFTVTVYTGREDGDLKTSYCYDGETARRYIGGSLLAEAVAIIARKLRAAGYKPDEVGIVIAANRSRHAPPVWYEGESFQPTVRVAP